MLFHSVIGEDMREERSPSFFNPSEVAVVINYVEELMATRKGGIKLKPEDIGIISPYRKQVCSYQFYFFCYQKGFVFLPKLTQIR